MTHPLLCYHPLFFIDGMVQVGDLPRPTGRRIEGADTEEEEEEEEAYKGMGGLSSPFNAVSVKGSGSDSDSGMDESTDKDANLVSSSVSRRPLLQVALVVWGTLERMGTNRRRLDIRIPLPPPRCIISR